MENLVQWFIDVLNGISGEWVAFIISMVPLLELRGGLLAASLLGVDILKAVPICIIGNIIPVPFILLFITPIFSWLKITVQRVGSPLWTLPSTCRTTAFCSAPARHPTPAALLPPLWK